MFQFRNRSLNIALYQFVFYNAFPTNYYSITFNDLYYSKL